MSLLSFQEERERERNRMQKMLLKTDWCTDVRDSAHNSLSTASRHLSSCIVAHFISAEHSWLAVTGSLSFTACIKATVLCSSYTTQIIQESWNNTGHADSLGLDTQALLKTNSAIFISFNKFHVAFFFLRWNVTFNRHCNRRLHRSFTIQNSLYHIFIISIPQHLWWN